MKENTSSLPLNWSDKYRTGHSRVDNQHKQLFILLEELEAALLECRGNAVARQALLALADYSRYHFEDEEKFMQRIGFPELAQHRLEHGSFITEIHSLLEELDVGKPVLTVELIYFVKNWLVEHILNSDMKIRDHQNTLSSDEH